MSDLDCDLDPLSLTVTLVVDLEVSLTWPWLYFQVFEEALKTWLEKQKISESSSSSSEHDQLSHVENNILLDFAEVAESLIRRSELSSLIIETNTH